jgi:alkyldihydroxyacetonephosphate synthase
VLRLSDEAETAVGLAKPATVGTSPSHPGCLMIVGFEGEPAAVEERRAATSSRLTVRGGERREDDEGAAWADGRYRGPYLRDALLDEGVLVETLETATFWSNLAAVYESVRDAITSTLSDFGTPPIVLCHVSHVYPTGASLYFTVAAKEADDPLAQWQAAKTAASEAVVAAGATITHHHAVGRDHKPWLDREVGSVGVEILRAVKARLDPAGILNPGVLIP